MTESENSVDKLEKMMDGEFSKDSQVSEDQTIKEEIKLENEGTPEENLPDKNDPFAYLERGEFSSEKFKIEVKNLPKFYGFSEFRKLLNEKLKLNVNKLKTPKRNSPFAFICFRSEQDRENALKILNEYKWKGKSLIVSRAKPAPDPLVKKRKDNDLQNSQDDGTKKRKLDISQEERLLNSVVPLWNIAYEEQLKMKQESAQKILKKIGNSLSHSNHEIKTWLIEQKEKFDGLPCELLDIRFSEQYNGYRNKCEFTVGMDEETGLKTVGFRIGSYVNGITGVGPIDKLSQVPESMKVLVKLYQDFVRSSKLEVFNPEVQTGHFRQLTVRVAENQLMAIIGIHPQNLSADELVQFKKELIDFFSEGPGRDAKVTSLYYQQVMKRTTGQSLVPAEHLWGDVYIYETILGLKFRISPEAFFQVNTKAAEVLYKSAIELANVNMDSTVLDVCCGTGTIGLCFSKYCKDVLGLEIIPQAIVDAKENAKINDITNSEFYEGKAEEMLGSVCYNSKTENIIAVVDPPRAGLHHKAVQQIRKVTKIKKLLYISCNPDAAFKNFIDLGRPESKTLHGEAFVPVKAVAVDMFPHTRHYELIVCFERWDNVCKTLKNV